MRKLIIATVVVLFSGRSAPAQIDVGSDGSDGVFNPAADVTIDLSLAADAAWNTPSPVSGQGVYDANEWAVVFKYSSVTIPAGVTVTFTNHPARAPVVWLVQGDVSISGTVGVSTLIHGHESNEAPALTPSGPGGFRGGRGGTIGASVPFIASAGMGPGGGDAARFNNVPGAGGSYGTLGGSIDPLIFPGPVYGNTAILPLVGGSGGGGANASSPTNGWGGGGGGGAILIAANTMIDVSTSGRVFAWGSRGSITDNGGGGSGGAIRLVADAVVVQNGSDISARGGGITTGVVNAGGDGRIRIEGNTITLAGNVLPFPSTDLPTFVFPPPVGTPALRATLLNSLPVPADPHSDLEVVTNADVTLNTCDSVTLDIESENIPAGTVVDVRVVPKSGPATTVQSTPLAGAADPLTATATLTFPLGFSAVQLLANFAPGGGGSPAPSHQPTGLSDLRTLNGERVTRVEVASTPNGGSQLVYITEKGRRIPVGTR